MPDIETLLRSSLPEHAEQVVPRAEAIRDAKGAVHRKRRMQSATRGVAAAAAVAAIVATGTLWRLAGAPTAPTAQPSATMTATAPSHSPAPAPEATATTSAPAPSSIAKFSQVAILAPIFGGDYTAQPQSPSGFGGDLTLTPGSPSAAGLPAGYEVTVSLSLLGPMSGSANGPVDTMTALCGAMVEKGATMKGCLPQTVHGLSVQRAEVDAPNTKVGTWANLRILYRRPDKLVQYAEVTIWNTAHTTTVQERTAAAAWLHAQNTNLTTAATAATS